MHKYTVDLLISGDGLDESTISDALGFKASVFRRAGDSLSPRKMEKTSWSLFIDPPDGKPEWQDLDAGLRSLISAVRPRKDILADFGKRFTLVAYCGHFGAGFGGGPSISPETLAQLAGLGLTLTIKSYWSTNIPDDSD